MSNEQLIADLENLPDMVADQEKKWEEKAAELRNKRGKKASEMRLLNQGITSAEIKEKIDADDELYKLSLDVILEKSEHSRLEQKLLAAKKLATLRTAF